MTEYDALRSYKLRIRSATMHGAFRKGYRAAAIGRALRDNPYDHVNGGWSLRCWEAWAEGHRSGVSATAQGSAASEPNRE